MPSAASDADSRPPDRDTMHLQLPCCLINVHRWSKSSEQPAEKVRKKSIITTAFFESGDETRERPAGAGIGPDFGAHPHTRTSQPVLSKRGVRENQSRIVKCATP